MENTAASPSRAGKFLGVLIVIGLIVLVVLLDVRRRDAEKKLVEMSMKVDQQQGNQEQNRQAAKGVTDKVRKLYAIPEGVDPTVATIVDVNQLRARNAFYNKAKNGDYLIVTTDRAILYDPVADRIIDVVPVQIQAAAAASVSSKAPAAPAAAAKSSAAK